MNLAAGHQRVVQMDLFSEEDFKIWSSSMHCECSVLLPLQLRKEGTDYLF
jgi:hypothetical protein